MDLAVAYGVLSQRALGPLGLPRLVESWALLRVVAFGRQCFVNYARVLSVDPNLKSISSMDSGEFSSEFGNYYDNRGRVVGSYCPSGHYPDNYFFEAQVYQ